MTHGTKAICPTNRPKRATRAGIRPSGWPDRSKSWPVGLRSAQLTGDVAQVEAGHLVLERAQGDAEVARRGGDVPVGLLERAKDEVALERVARFLEQRFAGRRRRVELGEVVLEGEILVGDPVLVA